MIILKCEDRSQKENYLYAGSDKKRLEPNLQYTVIKATLH